MPVQVHNPIADFINQGWALVGSGVTALWQALSVVDDTKYIKCPATKGGAAITFPIDTTTVPDGAVITSITISLRCSTGSGSAPSGVAPSVTISVGALDDTSKFTARTIFPTSTPTTFEVATYSRDPRGELWDIYRLNNIFLKVFSYIAIFDLIRCHQLFCKINYRVRPTISVDAPSGTVYTSSPTISWTYTQADGDPQLKSEYRIFTADQVNQISFNPDITTPVYKADVAGDISSVTLPTSINPNNYWVYVRSYSSFKAKSVWTGRAFTVSGPAPGSPGVSDPLLPGSAMIQVIPDREYGAADLTLRDTSNMLSAQDGDSENAIDGNGFKTTNCTFVRDSSTSYPGGTSSWKMTASSAATMSSTTEWIEVDDSATITARAQFKTAVTARSVRVQLLFYDANFVTVGGTLTGSSVTDSTSTWTEAVVTGDIPDGAVYAKAQLDVLSPANAEVHNVDRVGVMYGDNTPWSDGGHMSRNLLSSWYSSPDGTPQAGEAWTAGTATTTTTVATTGTGASGSTCNKMTFVGASPSIAFRAAGTVFTSPTSGANFTLNKPAGTATGDLMLAYVSATGYVTMATVPVGWTLVNTAKIADGTLENLTMFILKRTAGGSEPASWTDGTISAVAGCRSAIVVGYSGAADASQQFIAETQVATGNANPLFLTTPAINNTDPSAWRVSAFAVSDDIGTGTLTANRQEPSVVPAITYVGAGTVWQSNGTGSFTINKPSGVVSGDLMVAVLGSVTSATVTPPAGWTVQYQGSYTSNGGPSLMAVMYRVAGGSEPASWGGTYSGGSSYGRNTVRCVAYRNVNTTTPFLASNGQSIAASSNIATPSVTNTNSLAWRISIFAGLTTSANTWTSTDTTERADNSYTYSSGTESVAIYDSNGGVGTGSYSRIGYASQGLYAANAFLGFLNPLAAPPSGVADETARVTTANIGSANPWLHVRAFDSAGVAATGSQALTGIWAPGSGTDKNSMVGWQGFIKPATPVTAGYASATMATYVDLSSIDFSKISDTGEVTATASFLGSTAGTPYLTVNFYRANVLLRSQTAQGSSFGTGTWVKSSATFSVPDGTTRMTMGVSVSDRAVSDYVLWDRNSLGFGADATYRKSTSRSTHPVWARPQIQYADDDGTGYTDWTDLSGLVSNPPAYNALSGLADYVDHTIIPLTNRKYRARTVSVGLAGDTFTSDWGPDSSEFQFVAENWWLKDIANPDNNIRLKVKWEDVGVNTTNTATVFQPLGEDLPVVLSEGYKGDTFSVSLRPVSHADWADLKQMLQSGRSLFLQSDIDHAWWVRPVGDLASAILATSKRQQDPKREIKVSFVQVKAEL